MSARTAGNGALVFLFIAVLVDAINILQGWHRLGSARKRRAFAEAGQWVNTRGTHYPFSFDSICDALSIAPDILRQRLLRSASFRLLTLQCIDLFAR